MTQEIIKHSVPPDRLDRDKGDIASSYSADTICFSSKIRKPFNYQGRAYVTTGICGDEFEAYSLARPEQFVGPTTNYGARACGPDFGEAARNDPNGFYHGMTVKSGKEEFVLHGPKVIFIAGHSDDNNPPAQLSLFNAVQHSIG